MLTTIKVKSIVVHLGRNTPEGLRLPIVRRAGILHDKPATFLRFADPNEHIDGAVIFDAVMFETHGTTSSVLNKRKPIGDSGVFPFGGYVNMPLVKHAPDILTVKLFVDASGEIRAVRYMDDPTQASIMKLVEINMYFTSQSVTPGQYVIYEH